MFPRQPGGRDDNNDKPGTHYSGCGRYAENTQEELYETN